MLYIFVEGTDDVSFIKNIISPMVKETVKIIEYAQTKDIKINNYIKSINSMGDNYIFLVDLDNKSQEQRILEISKKYKLLDNENVFFVIKEIESWYWAGISNVFIKKYINKNRQLKKILNTEELDKEMFKSLFYKAKLEPNLILKLEILDSFDIIQATEKNNSFKSFYEYININY